MPTCLSTTVLFPEHTELAAAFATPRRCFRELTRLVLTVGGEKEAMCEVSSVQTLAQGPTDIAHIATTDEPFDLAQDALVEGRIHPFSTDCGLLIPSKREIANLRDRYVVRVEGPAEARS